MAAHQFHKGDNADVRTSKAYARSGISFAPTWQAATDKVIANVMANRTAAPDLVTMFVSTAWSDHYQDIIARIRTETGCTTLIGCSSSGVIAGSCCHESAAGLSVIAMWLPDATITPMYIDNVPEQWPWGDAVSMDSVRGIMLFSDPYRTDAQATLVGLRKTCPGVPMIGALASTVRSDRYAWVYLNGEVYERGAVAITIEGPYDLLVRVSQGGTPVGETWTITSVDHNQIYTISNRPALDVMNDALAEIMQDGFGMRDLMIGLPMDEYRDVFSREDFVARGILSTDESTGSITMGGIPRQGQSIQFLKRDAKLASENLTAQLQDLGALNELVVGGILSTCKGRGTNMFGRNDHDAAAVAEVLPDVPTIGLYSLGELGPVRDVPAYNAFAVSLGLILER